MTRLSDELRVLARRHPRATWAGHANLGQVARFWLERHAMFRQLDAMIRDGAGAALDGGSEAATFKPWLARHLRWFLGGLEEHHQVEDLYYFPVFRKAEPRLLAGFELLERDHAALHAAIGRIVEQANAVLTRQSDEDLRAALGPFRDGQRALGRDLVRHLDDEEDLVVPLILERGEPVLLGHP